ncbi:MAG TPA: hypothetical protein VJR89_28305 [Polyangiales bacterium]|nr:hypothetical protein [Polyangiales bacterium]
MNDRHGALQHRFAFAGVSFRVRASRWELGAEYAALATDVAAQPTIADVTCEIDVVRGLPAGPRRVFSIEHDAAATQIASAELAATLSQSRPGHYGATARMAQNGADALVLGVAAAVHERHGGLNLHAAAIELDGRAVLFVGPSGAGKSTAAQLARGARVFAFDRVCVSRHAGAFTAFALPGGSPIDVPRSSQRALPVGAVFRIRQASGRPRIQPLTAAGALFALRESTEVTDPSAGAEERRIEAAARLSAAVPVAELHTVLGYSHLALLGASRPLHAIA